MLADLLSWIVQVVGSLGYPGIFFLMFLESSFFPFPSEVVMVPAGYLAYQGEMHLVVVVICGILGSLAGALFNYYLAVRMGRPLLLRYGQYVMFKESALQKMELFFARHGHISTFTGRLIPGVRQYISLPAGLARMNLPLFCFYTSLGAGIWVLILAVLGYYIGGNEAMVKTYLREIVLYLLLACAAGLAVYWYFNRRKKY
ncbi:DedA family protein [Nitrosomonas mobilis]|uniref:SNARE associated protein n=1 Tax=Nitrosomonas mobilis TaxID=51642 RepID=A0A1G5SDP8_9PROT|nr:DedA family protein [Nitrosomonas mobilis]SCZ85262.1 SNARE associated protein [Nitrosomonas mobilis]HNO74996.1 DedA family protein [Nitrosomonas mobilis]